MKSHGSLSHPTLSTFTHSYEIEDMINEARHSMLKMNEKKCVRFSHIMTFHLILMRFFSPFPFLSEMEICSGVGKIKI